MNSTKMIRSRILPLLGILLGSLFSINLSAQTIKISGNIINQGNATPVPGATVSVKNSHRFAITDEAGKFTIDASTGDVLVITMIGYQKKEVVVAKSTSIQVKLAENVSQLEDVVVIGYGKIKRPDVTGAISSVSGDEIRKTQPVTFDQALQGKVPGLVAQQISGQPGGAVSVQIRGLSSFSGGSPMYVIDGVIIGGTATLGSGVNPLAGINPSEIESIDVLKDASATAIYGSQATNGVIVITTRRGKVAPPSISYDMYTGYQQIAKKLPVMNLREYAAFINERNTGLGWGFDTRPEFVNPKYLGVAGRVTVHLTPASRAALAHATEITGDTRTDTINRAIQTYSLLADQVDNGAQVLLAAGPTTVEGSEAADRFPYLGDAPDAAPPQTAA